jgi:UDP-N-acetylmuramate dehydrogenase
MTHHEVVRRIHEMPGRLTDVHHAVLGIRKQKGMLEGQQRSAGSFFKNPTITMRHLERRFGIIGVPEGRNRWWWPTCDDVRVSAAWLIELVGFEKGTRRGAVGISPYHALALVNRGDARAADIVTLAREIQEKVAERFGIVLEPEVRMLGFADYPLLNA